MQEKRINLNDRWTTEDEIRHIQSIDKHPGKVYLNKRAMLMNYKKAMPNRTNWGEINRFAVFDAVYKELGRC